MHVYRLRILEYHCASKISLADRVFLQELAHVSTGEQMGNVCNNITVTWASSSKYDEFSFCFCIAQFYKSN